MSARAIKTVRQYCRFRALTARGAGELGMRAAPAPDPAVLWERVRVLPERERGTVMAAMRRYVAEARALAPAVVPPLIEL